MSDTTTQECINCGFETDCIEGICQECALDEGITIPTKRLYELLKFETENKQLREAVEEAKVKRGQYREIIEALLVPTNFIGIEAARDYICEALETYGLGKIEEAK